MGDNIVGPLVAGWLVMLAGSDRRTYRLPNHWTVPALGAVVAAGTHDPIALFSALAAAVPYLIVFGVGHCGGGDVKVAFVVGGLAADPVLAALIIVGAHSATLWAHRRSRSRTAAHGPPLCGSTVLVLGLV